VRAGVPRSLDDITDRLLADPPRHHAPPITSAAGLSAALSGIVGSSHEPPNQMDETVQVARQNGSIDDATQVAPQLPPALDPTPPAYQSENGHQQHSAYQTAAETRPVRRQTPPPSNGKGGRRRDEPKPKGSWGGRILILLAILALLSVVAMAQFLLKGGLGNNSNDGSGDKTTSAPPATSTTPSATGGPAKIVSAKDFDPEPAGNGSEHPEEVKNSYDGNPSTTWTTQSYFNKPNLGGQKPGVGIVYDLGAPTAVSSVAVAVQGDKTSLQLMIPKGDTSTSPTTVAGWTPIATQADQPEGTVTLKPSAPTSTRYVLVWLTKLPKDGSGYRGTISEVTIQK
jgi:hypothetical protein